MSKLPLEGIKVIDLTHSAAGPFATYLVIWALRLLRLSLPRVI
ncbi:hypothetical protein [Vulcanisaeta sp. JCM 14467]